MLVLKWIFIILIALIVLLFIISAVLFRVVNFLSRPDNPAEAKREGERLAKMSGKTIIAVVAHPDDIDWYAGGTLAALIRNQNKVIVVLGTSGEKGGNLSDLGKVREEEQQKSGKVLGYSKIIFLGHPDKGLKPDIEFKAELFEIFNQYKPEILFTFDTEKENLIYRHPDHEAAGLASQEVAKNSATIEEIYLFHTSKPDVIFDISSYLDLKSSALKLHQSQFLSHKISGILSSISRIFLGRSETSAGFNQSFLEVGIKAGEVFRIVKR